MHPYAGNPDNFPAAVLILDDSDTVTLNATNLNTPSQGALDRTAYLFKRFQNGTLNWQLPFGPFLSATPENLMWDEPQSMWITVGVAGGGFVSLLNLDGMDGVASSPPVGYSNFGSGLTPRPIAISADATNLYALISDISTGITLRTLPRSNFAAAWTTVFSVAFSASILAIEMVAFNGHIIFGVEQASAHGFYGWETVPSGSGGASIDVGYIVGGWTIAVSGAGAVTPHVLVIPKAAHNPPQIFRTTDGSTFTTVAGPWGNFDTPISVAWGVVKGQPAWLAVVSTGGGTAVSLWSSPDGIAWTAQGFVLSQKWTGHIYCPGALSWIGMTWDSGTGTARALMSADGVTWYQTQAVTLSAPNAPRLAASNTQVAWVTTSAVRFSYAQGLPLTPVT